MAQTGENNIKMITVGAVVEEKYTVGNIRSVFLDAGAVIQFYTRFTPKYTVS